MNNLRCACAQTCSGQDDKLIERRLRISEIKATDLSDLCPFRFHAFASMDVGGRLRYSLWMAFRGSAPAARQAGKVHARAATVASTNAEASSMRGSTSDASAV